MCVMCILLQWKNNKTQIHLIKKKVYLNELGIIMSPSLQRPVKSLLEAYTVNRGRFELKFSLTRQPQRSPPLRVPAHSCWAENVSIFVHPFVQSDVSLRAYFVPKRCPRCWGPAAEGREAGPGQRRPTRAHLKQRTHLLVLILQRPEPPPGCLLQGAVYTPLGTALHAEGEGQILKRTEGEGWDRKRNERKERIR